MENGHNIRPGKAEITIGQVVDMIREDHKHADAESQLALEHVRAMNRSRGEYLSNLARLRKSQRSQRSSTRI